MNIQAKETYYRGIKYRSRIEARWAVFFDVLGIEKHYEPEKFDLGNGVVYIPDFFLPKISCFANDDREVGIFFEVKGADLTPEDISKPMALSGRARCEVLVFSGGNFDSGVRCLGVIKKTIEAQFMQCPFCGSFGFEVARIPKTQEDIEQFGFPRVFSHRCSVADLVAEKNNIDEYFMDFTNPLDPTSTDFPPITNHSPMLDIAYDLAKAARFEDPNFETQVQATEVAVSRLLANKVFAFADVTSWIALHVDRLRNDPHCPKFQNYTAQRMARNRAEGKS